MKSEPRNLRRNFVSLYGMMIAQMIFPLLLFPYLTRILGENEYGVVVYIRTCMQYVVMIVEFGFIYSATRTVAELREENANNDLALLTGSVLQAKGMLAIVSLAVPLLFYLVSPILKGHEVYLLVSYISIALYSLLPDFLFRGLELMHVLTLRFVISKGVSTLLTFLMVTGNNTMIFIPLVDLAGTVVALIWTYISMRKLNLQIRLASFDSVFKRLRESFPYFLSGIASNQYNAVCVLLLGMASGSTAVAQWGVVMQIVLAVQSLYTPIANGIYPYMIRKKDFGLIRKVLLIASPILLVGGVIGYLLSETIVTLLAGELYSGTAHLLRLSIPLIAVAFPATILGWPVLGAIGLESKVAQTTIGALLLEILLLVILYFTSKVTLSLVLLARTSADIYMLISRIILFYKHRKVSFPKYNAS